MTQFPAIELKKNEWQVIAFESCYIQNTSAYTIYIAELSEEPPSITGAVEVPAGQGKSYEQDRAMLWAICPIANVHISKTIRGGV